MNDDNPYSPPQTPPPDAVPRYDKFTALLIKLAAFPAGVGVCIIVAPAVGAMLAGGLPPPTGGIVGLVIGIVAGVMATRHCFRVANLTRPRKPR